MGQGYVGLPLAMAAVKAGHDVFGFEPDRNRCSWLKYGNSYIEDVPDSELRNALIGDRYTPTFDEDDLKGFDVAVITVPTPLKDRLPDLSYIEKAARMLSFCVDDGSLVILESTTHPGTTRDVLIPILEDVTGARAGVDFHVGFSPERIDPGNQRWSFDNTPKIVAGLTPDCLRRVADFYGAITQVIVPTASLEEAELAKVFENTYRHVNIALVNELQRLSHSLGIDVHNVLDLAATKPFGFTKFTPGPGVGGHCLPVDPVYLSHHVKTTLGQTFRLVELAQDINEGQPAYVVRRLQDALNERFGKALKGASILALGQAYKANTSDMRESPAVEVVELLWAKGAIVETVDPSWMPATPEGCYRVISPDGKDYSHLTEYDAVLLLTAHSDFDLMKVAESGAFVLDTRGVMPDAPHIERL